MRSSLSQSKARKMAKRTMATNRYDDGEHNVWVSIRSFSEKKAAAPIFHIKWHENCCLCSTTTWNERFLNHRQYRLSQYTINYLILTSARLLCIAHRNINGERNRLNEIYRQKCYYTHTHTHTFEKYSTIFASELPWIESFVAVYYISNERFFSIAFFHSHTINL